MLDCLTVMSNTKYIITQAIMSCDPSKAQNHSPSSSINMPSIPPKRRTLYTPKQYYIQDTEYRILNTSNKKQLQDVRIRRRTQARRWRRPHLSQLLRVEVQGTRFQDPHKGLRLWVYNVLPLKQLCGAKGAHAQVVRQEGQWGSSGC